MRDPHSRRVREIIRRAVEEAPLPSTLEELSPADLARVEEFARRLRVEPLPALHIARDAQKAAIAEARAAEAIADRARKARA